MIEFASPTTDCVRIRSAVERVLQDKGFQRAPVLSRLLSFLVDRSLEGVPVKSYTIATEALGRSDSDGADADTYARVAVTRLRKALTAYYASHPDEDEIVVDTGSYAVRIRMRSDQAQAPEFHHASGSEAVEAAAFAPATPASGRTRWQRYVLAGMGVVLLIALVGYLGNWRSREVWLRSDFPTLAIVSADQAEVAPDGAEVGSFHTVLRVMMADYMGMRLIESDGAKGDYEVRLEQNQADEGPVQTVSLVETATGRVVWTRQYAISDQASLVRNAQRAAAAIGRPGGALDVFGRRKGLTARTPYGCWLRFTGAVMSYSSRTDSALLECAEDWHKADEGSRTAAFLRNWTMVDAAMTTLGDDSRREQLDEALTVIHRGLATNPENGMLYVGEMRTYSFLGQRDGVRQAARSALEAAPDNRVITGMAGTWLAFWNDPQGKQILGDLEADPETNLPWEHAGQFVVAMMDEDVERAGQHLSFLRIYLEDQPALNLLEAAYRRRSGQRQAAEVALDRIRSHPRAWFVGPEEILQRMPLAPEVKTRLRQWLAYQPAPVATPPAG